ncbi:RNA 2',3'-cyclic phosphodiesterase [bacterium BD-1]|nr:RNA 2',3'-cyclic phosphodiesterase [Ottowia caeni]
MFFALWPDAATREAIAAATASLEAGLGGGRRIPPHRYHLTLPFLGEHPADCGAVVAASCRAAARVHASAFTLVLDRAAGFPIATAPCFLGCTTVPPGLHALWDALERELAVEAVPVRAARERVPHVTVQRGAKPPWPDTPLPAPVRWDVRDFHLLRSDLRGGFAYDLLASWPLAAAR